MTGSPPCPRCGRDLRDDAPHGLCPSCLIAVALAAPEENVARESGVSGAAEETTDPEDTLGSATGASESVAAAPRGPTGLVETVADERGDDEEETPSTSLSHPTSPTPSAAWGITRCSRSSARGASASSCRRSTRRSSAWSRSRCWARRSPPPHPPANGSCARRGPRPRFGTRTSSRCTRSRSNRCRTW